MIRDPVDSAYETARYPLSQSSQSYTLAFYALPPKSSVVHPSVKVPPPSAGSTKDGSLFVAPARSFCPFAPMYFLKTKNAFTPTCNRFPDYMNTVNKTTQWERPTQRVHSDGSSHGRPRVIDAPLAHMRRGSHGSSTSSAHRRPSSSSSGAHDRPASGASAAAPVGTANTLAAAPGPPATAKRGPALGATPAAPSYRTAVHLSNSSSTPATGPGDAAEVAGGVPLPPNWQRRTGPDNRACEHKGNRVVESMERLKYLSVANNGFSRHVLSSETCRPQKGAVRKGLPSLNCPVVLVSRLFCMKLGELSNYLTATLSLTSDMHALLWRSSELVVGLVWATPALPDMDSQRGATTQTTSTPPPESRRWVRKQ